MVNPHLYICDWRTTAASCCSSGLLLRFPWTALASAAPSQASERYSAARNTAKGDFSFRLRMDKIQVENVHLYARTCRSLLDESASKSLAPAQVPCTPHGVLYTSWPTLFCT